MKISKIVQRPAGVSASRSPHEADPKKRSPRTKILPNPTVTTEMVWKRIRTSINKNRAQFERYSEKAILNAVLPSARKIKNSDRVEWTSADSSNHYKSFEILIKSHGKSSGAGRGNTGNVPPPRNWKKILVEKWCYFRRLYF